MSGATAKEKHYWTQLHSALISGQWLALHPAKTPKAELLSWTELFRKFLKHTGQRGRTFHDIASQNYALAVVLATTSVNEDEDYAVERHGSVELGEECLLPSGRMEDSLAGYEALKTMEPTEGLHHSLAYYAHALGKPDECSKHLGDADLASLPPSDDPERRPWTLTETFRSLCLRGMSHERLYPDDPLRALRVYTSSMPAFKILTTSPEFKELTKPPTKGPNGTLNFNTFLRYRELWRWVERLVWRGVCLSARLIDVHHVDANEEEGDTSIWTWLEKYTIVSSSWPPNFRSEHRSTISVVYLRALVLRHAGSSVVPPSQGSAPSVPEDPPSLPPAASKRNSIAGSIALSPSSSNASQPSATADNNYQLWLQTARSLIMDYKTILSISTSFPKAGERNAKVEEFVDLCVLVWEAGMLGGSSGNGDWIVDILWWATRLTFNSSRVLRHMVKAFYVTGDRDLARRSARLYAQVVGKAWQASKQGAGTGQEGAEGEGEGDGYFEDVDSDENWVKTLVYGARMLCREAARHKGRGRGGREALEKVEEAAGWVKRAKERVPLSVLHGNTITTDPPSQSQQTWKRLHAELQLAQGICDVLLGTLTQGESSAFRQEHLDAGFEHVKKATETFSEMPQAHYQLAIGYLGKRDLESALESAGRALQEAVAVDRGVGGGGKGAQEARTTKYWHLLGLVLSALERWEDAEEMFEQGEEYGVPKGAEEAEVNGSGASGDAEEGESKSGVTVLSEGEMVVPSLSTQPSAHPSSTSSPWTSTDILAHIYNPLLRAHGELFPGCPPSREEIFEDGLELRMTKMKIVEIREGAEGAERGWVDVFTWVAEQKGLVAHPGGLGLGNGFGGGSHNGDQGGATSGPGTITDRGSTRRHSLDTQGGGIASAIMSMAQVSALGAATAQRPTSVASEKGSEREGEGSSGTSGERPEALKVARTMSVSSQATGKGGREIDDLPTPIPITIHPASPDEDAGSDPARGILGFVPVRRRSSSTSVDGGKSSSETTKSKTMQQKLKHQVSKSQAKISAVGKKIGQGVNVGASGLGGGLGKPKLKRSSSTPDFHKVLQQAGVYQASSIHSRRRAVAAAPSIGQHSQYDLGGTTSGTMTPLTSDGTTMRRPSPSPSVAPTATAPRKKGVMAGKDDRLERENRLMSRLWLMSASTFRRLGKVEQAKGAIQEAEVKDENNTGVWVQLALYYIALGHHQHAITTLQKALFIDPDDVPAIVHLSRLYLTPPVTTASPYDKPQAAPPKKRNSMDGKGKRMSGSGHSASETSGQEPDCILEVPPVPSSNDVDLACGLLTQSSKGRGWDVPEVWFYLAKAYGYQGRKDKETEALKRALWLVEGRGVREVGDAVGFCI
ncbi:hypothetical protein BKA70DRAFT_579522 [Coprinopsis sp. MPI-PUGE-AT-0042]|nr:hypothetical protein BKA70DRAFT_579522 [Coprinopsis sp. MPI-PUGE-AT-0042]